MFRRRRPQQAGDGGAADPRTGIGQRAARPLAMSLPAVVQHPQVLETAGPVRSEKVGRVRTIIEPKRGRRNSDAERRTV